MTERKWTPKEEPIIEEGNDLDRLYMLFNAGEENDIENILNKASHAGRIGSEDY